MNKIKDFFYNFIDILLLLAILLASGYVVYSNLNHLMNLKNTTKITAEKVKNKEESQVSITIPKNTDLEQLSKLLKSYSIIDNEEKFKEEFNKINKDAKIKSGDFKIKGDTTLDEIIKSLTE